MTKKELFRRICAHPSSGLSRRELESLSASSLSALLETLESGKQQMRGDESPELTSEDEEILDPVWESVAIDRGGDRPD